MQRCAFELLAQSANAKGCLGYDRRANALVLAFLPWQWVTPLGQYSAAIVQGNVDQAIKWDTVNAALS